MGHEVMIKSKNKLQMVNRILILILSLMIAYVFTWPAGANDTHHMLDDRAYMNCHGTLARPVVVNHTSAIEQVAAEVENREVTDEYETLPAGTEIIYIFEDDKPVFVNLYSEEGMNCYIHPHDYMRQELSEEDLVNPEEIEQNLTRITNEKAKRQAEYEVAQRHYKYMFLPSKLVYAIPVGIVLFALLCLLENKFKRPQIFTIEMSVILILAGFIIFTSWIALSAPCR